MILSTHYPLSIMGWVAVPKKLKNKVFLPYKKCDFIRILPLIIFGFLALFPFVLTTEQLPVQKTASCPKGKQWKKYFDVCLKSIPKKLKYREAEENCQKIGSVIMSENIAKMLEGKKIKDFPGLFPDPRKHSNLTIPTWFQSPDVSKPTGKCNTLINDHETFSIKRNVDRYMTWPSICQLRMPPKEFPKTKNKPVEFNASQLTVGSFYKNFEKEFREPKMFYYDQFGDLIIDGTVPGNSNPIVLDYKRYANTCTSNIFFFFNFVVPGKESVEAVMKAAKKANMTQQDIAEMLSTCPYGLTFCYEGQLDGDGVHNQYRVTNYLSIDEKDVDSPAQKVALQCMLANDIPNAHGFNAAVVAFPGLEKENIKTADGKKIDWNKYSIHWRFFVLTLSISKDEYYFLVPDNGRVMLQIGDRSSLRTYLIDSDGNELLPVQFEHPNVNGGEKQRYGTTTLGDDNLPDPENMEEFKDYRGLWMLYLDFKRRFNELQMVKSMHSEDCNMRVQIRSTRMRKCRTYLEDIAVTEPSDVEMDFIYTQEVGQIHKSEYGQEDVLEMVKKLEKEQFKKSTTKTGTEEKKENGTSTRTEKGEKKAKEKRDQTVLHAQAQGGAKVNFASKKPPASGPGSSTGGEGPLQQLGGPFTGGGGGGGGGAGGGGGIGWKNFPTAQDAGKSFLGEGSSEKAGLFNFASKLLDGSATSDAKKFIFQKAQEGIDTLSKLSNEGGTGINFLDKGKEAVSGIMRNGQQKLREFQDIVRKAGDGPFDLSNAIGFSDLLKQKSGALANSIGSIIGKSVDSGNGFLGVVGEQLSHFAAIGGAPAVQHIATGLQNIVSTSLGGELRGVSDVYKAMIPGGAESFIPHIPGLNIDGIPGVSTPGNMGGTSALGINPQLWKGNNFKKFAEETINNLPKAFSGLPGYQHLTKDVLGALGEHGFKMPSRFDEMANQFKDNLLDKLGNDFSNPEKVKNAMDFVGESKGAKAAIGVFNFVRRTGGSIVERGWNIDPSSIIKQVESHIPVGRRRKRQTENGGGAGFGGGGGIGLGGGEGAGGGGGEGEFSVNAQANAEIHAGAKWSNDNVDSTDTSDSSSAGSRMFSDVSASQSLMESFKNTHSTTDLMSNTQFSQSSKVFTQKEIADFKVTGLPKNSKIVVSQMIFECDGNVIKMPRIIFHNGSEEIPGLSASTLDNKVTGIAGQDSNAVEGDGQKEKKTNSRQKRSIEYKYEIQKEQSMLSKFVENRHPDNWEKLTLYEKAAIDPYSLFEEYYEKEDKKKFVNDILKDLWEE